MTDHEVGPDTSLTFEVVTEQGFPWGLTCFKCARIIEVGQPYARTLVTIYYGDDPETISTLHCVYCGDYE